MKQGQVIRAASSACLIPTVWKTANAWERLRGLLGRPRLREGEALLIDPCPSVHTLGMRYALDLIFLDPKYRVLKLVSALPPQRWEGCRGARATLELAPGSLAALALETGEQLEWRAA